MSEGTRPIQASTTRRDGDALPDKSIPIHVTETHGSSNTNRDADPPLRYIDIGINLTDPVFSGIYHDKQAHPSDLSSVLTRAQSINCKKFMITGSDLTESTHAIDLAKRYTGTCYATVGVHPCSANIFSSHSGGTSALLSELKTLAQNGAKEGHVAAFGEFGLDYDRLFLCKQHAQLEAFEAQLDLAMELDPPLPLFLHSRAAAEDFEKMLRPRLQRLPKRGLVHSFTGTVEEMRSLVALGLDIGVNGCSLKTQENLDVVREIPLERLQLETDGPWCEIRTSHAGAKYLGEKEAPVVPAKAVKKEKWVEGAMVKGRNEPCMIAAVAYIVARVKGVEVRDVTEAAWRNSVRMFGLGESVGDVGDGDSVGARSEVVER